MRGEELNTVEEKKTALNDIIRVGMLAFTGKVNHKGLLTGKTEKETNTEFSAIIKHFLQMVAVGLDKIEIKTPKAISLQGCINRIRSVYSKIIDNFQGPSTGPTLAP